MTRSLYRDRWTGDRGRGPRQRGQRGLAAGVERVIKSWVEFWGDGHELPVPLLPPLFVGPRTLVLVLVNGAVSFRLAGALGEENLKLEENIPHVTRQQTIVLHQT